MASELHLSYPHNSLASPRSSLISVPQSPHNRAPLNSRSPRASSGFWNSWEAHAYVLHIICIMITSGLHVFTLRVHQPCAIFKLFLSNSYSMEIYPGFTESSFHDFWTLSQALTLGAAHLHPQSQSPNPSWRSHSSVQLERVTPTPAPGMHVDLTVTSF